MSSIYWCLFLGDGWEEWKGGHALPTLPRKFDEEGTTITMAFREDQDWCYAYDPEQEEIMWCTWTGRGWSKWEAAARLPPPPNFIIDEEEAFFSVSSHENGEWVVSYNPADGSVFWSEWTGRGYSTWQGPIFLDEDPPNLDDAADVFAAGDGEGNEWLISVNQEDWSVFYASWEGDGYSEWRRASDLPIPEEWLDLGVDIDGTGRDGTFYIYATVHDDE